MNVIAELKFRHLTLRQHVLLPWPRTIWYILAVVWRTFHIVAQISFILIVWIRRADFKFWTKLFAFPLCAYGLGERHESVSSWERHESVSSWEKYESISSWERQESVSSWERQESISSWGKAWIRLFLGKTRIRLFLGKAWIRLFLGKSWIFP